MNTILVLIAIFIAFIEDLSFVEIVDLDSKHAKIGDYPKIQMERCGYKSPTEGYNESDSKTLIIDGELASLGEFPWHATMFHKYREPRRSHLCDGVLIHRYWVITGKQCVTRRRDVDADIIPKVLNISFGTRDATVFYEVRNVSLIVRHPNTKVDLALLKLETPMDPVVSDDGAQYRINYICLPEENTSNSMEEQAISSGFGDSSIGHEKNNVLRKAVYTIDTPSECRLLRGWPIRYICSVELDHKTCYGDAGAGLVQFSNSRAMLIGTSRGGYSFDKAEDPCAAGIMLFVRMSYYIGFLRDVIEFNETFPEAQEIATVPTPLPPTTTENTTETIDSANGSEDKSEDIQTNGGNEDTFRVHSFIAYILITLLFSIKYFD